MLTARIYIDTRRKTKKGYPVKLQIYCTKTNQRKYIHLKQYQNSKTKQSEEAQEELRKLLLRLEPIRDFTLEEAYPEIQKESDLEIWAMQKKLEEHEAFVDFYEFTNQLIKEREIRDMDTVAFKAAIREVRKYMGDARFGLNSITYEWANSYRLHKIKNGTVEGGISYYLRTIRTIHNEGKKRESLGVKKTNPFKGLIRNTSSTVHQAKTWKLEDIKKLRTFRHPKATETTQVTTQRAIDIFLFQIAIGGHDFVDVANLKWENIHKEKKDKYRLRFQRYKNRNKPNGGRWVDNMLCDFALSIIAKYGDKNSERIFSFLPDPKSSKYTHRNYGATLRRISEVIGINPHLTTKTPRYVFRTTAGNLLVHDLIVESMLGHKPTSVSHKYQKGIPYELQDKEHQKIIDSIIMTRSEKVINRVKEIEKKKFGKKDKKNWF